MHSLQLPTSPVLPSGMHSDVPSASLQLPLGLTDVGFAAAAGDPVHDLGPWTLDQPQCFDPSHFFGDKHA